MFHCSNSSRKLFQQMGKSWVSRLWGYEQFKSKCIQGKPQVWRKEAGKGIKKKESRLIIHRRQRSVYKSQGFKGQLVAQSNDWSFLIRTQWILAHRYDLVLIPSTLPWGSKGRCHWYTVAIHQEFLYTQNTKSEFLGIGSSVFQTPQIICSQTNQSACSENCVWKFYMHRNHLEGLGTQAWDSAFLNLSQETNGLRTTIWVSDSRRFSPEKSRYLHRFQWIF